MFNITIIKKAIPIFIIGLFLAYIYGCRPLQRKQSDNQEAIPVVVSTIRPGELSETINYIGNVRAQDEIRIYPKVTGKIIEKVKEEGDAVSKDDAVAYIDRDEVGLKFERAPVESPISGFVGRIYVDIGSNVSPQTPVALVVNMDIVKIYLDIPEVYLPKISLAQEARIEVDAYPDQEFIGKVIRISPVIDIATRNAQIEINVDNQNHFLKSGMFASVELILETRTNIAVILREAVLGRDHDLYVFTVENNKAVLKKIKLGIRQGPYYEAREGLKDGDRVVIMGQQRLYEGASVIVEERKD